MTDREQAREASRIGALDDRQPQQQRRLQDGDEAADQKGHAVEISDLFRREIEGAAQNAGKHEHPGHAENILQSQNKQLIVRQPFVDADIEDFIRWGFPGLHGFSYPLFGARFPAPAPT